MGSLANALNMIPGVQAAIQGLNRNAFGLIDNTENAHPSWVDARAQLEALGWL